MNFKHAEMRLGFEKLGCLAHLMSTSHCHANQRLYSLALWAGQAVAHDQVEIFFRNGEPIGYIIWALLTPNSLNKLINGGHPLRPAEWNEGNIFCILDIMLPIGSMPSYLPTIKTLFTDTFYNILWTRRRKNGVLTIYGKNLKTMHSFISTSETMINRIDTYFD